MIPKVFNLKYFDASRASNLFILIAGNEGQTVFFPLNWKLTTFLILPFPSCIIVCAAVAKTTRSLPVFLRVGTTNNIGQKHEIIGSFSLYWQHESIWKWCQATLAPAPPPTNSRPLTHKTAFPVYSGVLLTYLKHFGLENRGSSVRVFPPSSNLKERHFP